MTRKVSPFVARADGPSVVYRGPPKTVDGVSFQSGQYYERPPSSTCTFKLSSRKYTVDAEGVIARKVRVVERTIITLASDQCRELVDFPSLSDL